MRLQTQSLAQVAERSWQVSPGLDEPPAPIYIEEPHFGRLQRGSEGQSPQELANWIRPKRHRAAPTMAFQLREATLVNGYLYCKRWKSDLFAKASVPGRWSTPVPQIDGAVFTGLYSSSRWYGHLHHDEFPLQMLASEMGSIVSHRRRIYDDEPVWRETLNLPAPPTHSIFVARDLIVLEDFGQNQSKKDRYAEIRSRLRHRPTGHQRIYLCRYKLIGEKRVLVNEDDLIIRFQAEGFSIVEPELLGPEETIRQCMHARTIVTVDGSHAAPTFFCAADQALMLFLLPPQRVTPQTAFFAWMYGLRGGMFIGERVEGDGVAFRVDVDELLRFLEKHEA